ncbi:MAG: class I SAM-dependent methyltransferase [Clostridiales bacterium]|nr:class I SAM-dependent methyltransferase [Clostridiales bacterium]
MEAYTGFASLYDLFMDNIPYKEWSQYLTRLLHEYNVFNGIILDLGCGTGTITELLAANGYDMIGIDNSEEMLNKALDKKSKYDSNTLYINQDMREFELYGTVSAVVSICDSINYITEPNDLLSVFKLVNNYLDPGGIFIFDLNTRFKYQQMGDETIAENRDEGSFIWENYFYPEENINEYDLTIFVPRNDGLFEKFEETHLQRAYSLDEIKSTLESAGMNFVTAYDAFTHEPVNDTSERIYIIAKECGKQINK